MPWPRLKMCGLPACRAPGCRPPPGPAPRRRRSGRWGPDCLARRSPDSSPPSPSARRYPATPHPHPCRADIGFIAGQGRGAGKADDPGARSCRAHRGDDLFGGLDHHLFEQRRRQARRPAVENLHRIGAGIDLADQVEGDTFPQNIQKACEALWIAIGPKLGRLLFVAACARPPDRSPRSRARPQSPASVVSGGRPARVRRNAS